LRGQEVNKKYSCPSTICWDKSRYPLAVPPGLAHLRPLCAYNHMLNLFTKFILRLTYSITLSVRPRESIRLCLYILPSHRRQLSHMQASVLTYPPSKVWLYLFFIILTNYHKFVQPFLWFISKTCLKRPHLWYAQVQPPLH